MKRGTRLKFGRIFLIVVSIAIYGYAVGYVFTGIRINEFTNSSKNWPSTKGSVTSIDFKSWTTGKGSYRNYKLIIEYQYSVAGKEYNNDRISSNLSDTRPTIDQDAATRRLQQLEPPSGRINVFYDPEDPSRSMLIWEEFSLFKRILSCIFLAFIGSIFMWLGINVPRFKKYIK